MSKPKQVGPALFTETARFSSLSTIPSALIKTHVRQLLLLKGAVFGEFVATEFSDDVLQEHVLSVSVTDIPPEIQVIYNYAVAFNCQSS